MRFPKWTQFLHLKMKPQFSTLNHARYKPSMAQAVAAAAFFLGAASVPKWTTKTNQATTYGYPIDVQTQAYRLSLHLDTLNMWKRINYLLWNHSWICAARCGGTSYDQSRLSSSGSPSHSSYLQYRYIYIFKYPYNWVLGFSKEYKKMCFITN